jgi:toxin-antitoxin system PIN domain toxin
MLLIDVNVLVYAHRGDADRHTEYRAWLESLLDGNGPFGASELVLAGFMRIVTHPQIYRLPSPLADALESIEQIRGSRNYVIVTPGPRHWDIFIDLCRKGNARGNLVMDAYHAALAIEHGCEWVTVDRGFARWPGLKWRHPLDE